MICARSDYANVAGMICGARSSLAQVDGARRDLLETMSHRRRGDIVSIYTSFPWPALYAEIWLKICDPIGNRKHPRHHETARGFVISDGES